MWVMRVGDCIGFLGVFKHCLEVERGIGDENDLYIEHVGVLFVCLDVAVADLLEVNAALYGFLWKRGPARGGFPGDMRTM